MYQTRHSRGLNDYTFNFPCLLSTDFSHQEPIYRTILNRWNSHYMIAQTGLAFWPILYIYKFWTGPSCCANDVPQARPGLICGYVFWWRLLISSVFLNCFRVIRYLRAWNGLSLTISQSVNLPSSCLCGGQSDPALQSHNLWLSYLGEVMSVVLPVYSVFKKATQYPISLYDGWTCTEQRYSELIVVRCRTAVRKLININLHFESVGSSHDV